MHFLKVPKVFFNICKQMMYQKPVFSIYTIIDDCFLIFLPSENNNFFSDVTGFGFVIYSENSKSLSL